MKYSISKSQRKPKSIANSVPILILCLIVFFFSAKAAYKAYREKHQSQESLQNTKEELSKLEKRDTFIKNELKQVSTETGREARLREKFGVGRPGEQVAIIVEGDLEATNASEEANIWNSIKVFFSSLLKK